MNFGYNLRLFKEIFFPRNCHVCGQEIDTGLVCDSCRKNYILHKVELYGSTGEVWQKKIASGQPLVAEDYFDRVEYLYRYDGIFKEALHSLKFEAAAEFLPLLKEEAELALAAHWRPLLRHYDYVACVPTSKERRAQRGFDVPWTVFACLKSGQAEYTDKLLERIKTTAPLFSMGAEERRTEIADCFKVLNEAKVRDKRILLCDDIYTTGTTLMEAAKVLLKAGARTVGALTLCASKDNWD